MSNIKTEEDSIDEKAAVIQSIDKWITEEINEEGDAKDMGERSWRNYLKHTKTSRMKSVNRRDQHIKENIKSEAQIKFENPALKKVCKDNLPPGLPQGNSTVVGSSLTNWIKRQSPIMRANEDILRNAPHCSSIVNPDMFKLEGKTKALGVRKGSRTNRDAAESFDWKLNFRAFEDRRAEHKNQRITQNNSGIPNIKSYDKKPTNKFNKTDKFERNANITNYKETNHINPEVDRDQLLKNLRSNYTANYNCEDSPKIKNKEKILNKSPERDVLDCLKSPGSPSRITSMLWETMFQKSLDFGTLLMAENDSIFTIAGYSDKPIETIENYKSNSESWSLIECPLKDPLTKFASVAYTYENADGSKSERILIIGGKMGTGKRTDQIYEYDPNTNNIREFIKLPKPVSGFAAVCISNKVYIIGGNDGKIRNQVNWLDIDTMQWSLLPPLISKRDELSAAIGPDGWIYAIGGYGGSENKWLKTAERYNFTTNTWTTINEMIDSRRALTAVSLPNGVYAIGGYNGDKYLDSVERYDCDLDEWVTVKSMISSRWTLSSVSSTDCRYIYAIGGFDGSAKNTVERYDVFDDKWEMIQSMHNKRFMHSSVLIKQ